MINPYLSVVVVGRNDNYGVNFLQRLNTFIQSLDYQTQKHKDLLELIIVEWNPQSDRDPLKDVIVIPKNFSVRIITVPSEVHNTIPDVSSPVLEFWGKNVGIRRARGEFVLISNPDILFTQTLIDMLAQRNLDTNVVYRTDRYDYHGDGIENISVEGYIDFALKNTFKAQICPSTVEVTNAGSFESLPKTNVANFLFTNASGDFMLSAKENFFKSYGLAWENSITRGHVDSFSLIRLTRVAKLTAQVIFRGSECIFHMDHPRAPNTISWKPDIAIAATEWAGWLATPSFFNSNWGLADYNFIEWSSKQ